MLRRCSAILVFVVGIVPVSAQVAFTSSNLPIIVIDTQGQEIVDEPKITANMGIIFNGAGVRNQITDPFNNYNGKIGIEIRGSSSQMFPKKQYGIELRNSTGSSIDASLLGLPKKDDWVLLAPYNDKSLMRDVLAYKMGRATGRYASRSVYCELVLNGEYRGIYVLLEKVKRDKNRVNIEKLDPVETSGENLTGGYIIKIDKTAGNGGEGWESKYVPPGRASFQTIYFQYEYPKQTDIVAEQKQYIKSYVDQFEDALMSEHFMDPVDGYAKYIDVGSFVDYFLVNELARNPDAYRLSTFIHKQKDAEGGKLRMGPVWDFNLGFGNVDFCAKEKPEGFVIDYNSICPGDFWLIPFWWHRLFQDPSFQTKVADRWTTLRAGPLQTTRLLTYIDSVASVLNEESQQRNFQYWPVLGQYVWPNAYVGATYSQEVNWLKSWLTERLGWLDANIPHVVTALDKAAIPVRIFPNPSSQGQPIYYQISSGGYVELSLTDLSGKAVSHFSATHTADGVYAADLWPAGAAAGVYILTVRHGYSMYREKVIRK